MVSFPFINTNCATPSFAYILAGKGVVFENSRVTCPSHPGSSGVTLTIIPHLAYVDLPRQMTKTFSGILKYSIVLASANEFGGIIHSLAFFVTKLSFENFRIYYSEFTLVNILNSSETLAS